MDAKWRCLLSARIYQSRERIETTPQRAAATLQDSVPRPPAGRSRHERDLWRRHLPDRAWRSDAPCDFVLSAIARIWEAERLARTCFQGAP